MAAAVIAVEVVIVAEVVIAAVVVTAAEEAIVAEEVIEAGEVIAAGAEVVVVVAGTMMTTAILAADEEVVAEAVAEEVFNSIIAITIMITTTNSKAMKVQRVPARRPNPALLMTAKSFASRVTKDNTLKASSLASK